MIKKFKIFEEVENETTFFLNDLMIYYNKNQTKIKKFIIDLLTPGKVVKFNYKYAYNKNTSTFLPINKEHIDIIYSIDECNIGYKGTLQNKISQFVVLTITLKNNIDIEYRIDVNLPFTVYGDITRKQKIVIDELNLIRKTNKFNL